ncbi:hypothetical protein V2G26_011857 [Clonostachys chloroleuca]
MLEMTNELVSSLQPPREFQLRSLSYTQTVALVGNHPALETPASKILDVRKMPSTKLRILSFGLRKQMSRGRYHS